MAERASQRTAPPQLSPGLSFALLSERPNSFWRVWAAGAPGWGGGFEKMTPAAPRPRLVVGVGLPVGQDSSL